MVRKENVPARLSEKESFTMPNTQAPPQSELVKSLQDACEIISSASALGMTIPAPAGVSTYESLIHLGQEEGIIHLGLYPIEEFAKEAVAGWALEQLDLRTAYGISAPWQFQDAKIKNREQWIAESTDDEIIESYFDEGNDDYYTISQRTVFQRASRFRH